MMEVSIFGEYQLDKEPCRLTVYWADGPVLFGYSSRGEEKKFSLPADMIEALRDTLNLCLLRQRPSISDYITDRQKEGR